MTRVAHETATPYRGAGIAPWTCEALAFIAGLSLALAQPPERFLSPAADPDHNLSEFFKVLRGFFRSLMSGHSIVPDTDAQKCTLSLKKSEIGSPCQPRLSVTGMALAADFCAAIMRVPAGVSDCGPGFVFRASRRDLPY